MPDFSGCLKSEKERTKRVESHKHRSQFSGFIITVLSSSGCERCRIMRGWCSSNKGYFPENRTPLTDQENWFKHTSERVKL